MDMSVIIAGFGGQGILLAGKLLCQASVIEGKNTTWIPSYGAEMRGGSANCSVNISEDEISSPLIDKADVVIALNEVSHGKFENRVKPGGLMIVNSSLSKIEQARNDIKYVFIPLNEMAQKITHPAFINVMALGAFLAKTNVLKLESLKTAMKEMAKTVSAKKAALLPNNLESFDLGANFINNLVPAL